MERFEEHQDLAVALAELRQTPRETFARELDERVAAGFPRHSPSGTTPLGVLADRIRDLTSQRLLFASGTAALATIAIATVVVASNDSHSGNFALKDAQPTAKHPRFLQFSAPAPRGVNRAQAAAGNSAAEAPPFLNAAPSARGESEVQMAVPEDLSNANSSADLVPYGRRANREIERSAVIALLAEPADVADDSNKVFAAVHDADGIVLHSTTSSGSNAGARFALLIPSARLGDALAALSSIDEVSSRHEATDDITAPTVSAREELRDSRARIDTLLAQLSAAETETEAAAVEAELRGERRHAAGLRARLANLDRRTTYSRVSVRIASDPSADSGGTWGFDDAVGDAGHILAVAAAVTLVGLAIAAPIALIAFLAWLAHRLWLRTRRERALDA